MYHNLAPYCFATKETIVSTKSTDYQILPDENYDLMTGYKTSCVSLTMFQFKLSPCSIFSFARFFLYLSLICLSTSSSLASWWLVSVGRLCMNGPGSSVFLPFATAMFTF